MGISALDLGFEGLTVNELFNFANYPKAQTEFGGGGYTRARLTIEIPEVWGRGLYSSKGSAF
jgi:hypothetical protein